MIHTAAQPSHDWAAATRPRTSPSTPRDAEAARGGRHHAPDAASSSPPPTRSTETGRTISRCEEHESVMNFQPTTARPAASPRPCPSTTRLHSLFGVSKTAADLLVQEYGRYFGMRTDASEAAASPARPLRRGAARVPVLSHEVHGHRRAVHECTATAASRCATTSIALTWSAHSSTFTRAPSQERSTTSAAGAKQLLDARGDRRCPGIAGRRLEWELDDTPRIGDHKLVDQRPAGVSGRISVLAHHV